MNTPPLNAFCWNELATSDAGKCITFYTKMFGWTAHSAPVASTTYTLFKQNDRDVCGMLQMTAEWGDVSPHWMAYVSVEDVDRSAQQVGELGGKVCVPPTDIPPVGRFAVVQDPTGATFSIIKLWPKA